MLATFLLLFTASAQTHVYPYGVEELVGKLETPSGQRYVGRLRDGSYTAANQVAEDRFTVPPGLSDAFGYGDMNGDGFDETLHADIGRDEIVAIDIRSGAELLRLPVQQLSAAIDVKLYDLDADGIDEFVGHFCGDFCVMDAQGVTWWSLPGVPLGAHVLVEGDGDAEPELLIRNELYEPVTGLLTGYAQISPTAETLSVADFDADGRDDVVYTEAGARVAVDIRTGATWWTRNSTYHRSVAPEIADLNGDGLDDVLWDAPLMAIQGATGAPINVVPQRCGSYATAVAFDAGEPAFVGCDYIPWFTNVHGEVLDLRALRHVDHVVALDLSASGEQEVITLGDRVTVFDAGGDLLTIDDLPAGSVDVLRLPGDRQVLVRSDAGLTRMLWQPTTGLVPGAAILATASPFRDPHLFDGTGNGRVDLFFRDGNWSMVDLATGSIQQHLFPRDAQLAELDGTPGPDRLRSTAPGVYLVETSDGSAYTIPCDHAQVIASPTGRKVLSTSGPEVRLHDFHGGWSTVADVTLPIDRGGAWFAAGRVWFQRGDGIAADAMDGQPPWLFPTDRQLAHPPMVTTSSVWLPLTNELQRWDLP